MIYHFKDNFMLNSNMNLFKYDRISLVSFSDFNFRACMEYIDIDINIRYF